MLKIFEIFLKKIFQSYIYKIPLRIINVRRGLYKKQWN